MTKVLGLTGGIASGKSAVGELLRARGAVIVDADQLARKVVEPGQPALAELVARFGAEILDADGGLDRKKLGARVFADPAARAEVGRITHPRIAAASQAEIARASAAGAPVVFYEAALLVENQVHEGLDGLIVVAAPVAVQRERLKARDGIDEAAADARLAAQLPLEEKLAVATWVIDNSGDRAQLERQVDLLWRTLEARFGAVAPRTSAAMAAVAAPDEPDPPAQRELVLLTGFPAQAARLMLLHVLAEDAAAELALLVPPAAADDAARMVAAHAPAQRVQLIVGDPGAMDLGLTTDEYRTLAGSVTIILHLAGSTSLGVDAATAHRENVAATREIVDLAGLAPRLARLVYGSSVRVSGKRTGLVREDELDVGARFHNPFEATRAAAEGLVREAMRRLPTTIVRPGVLVGDSRTGEIDRFDGPYFFLVPFATRGWPVNLPLPSRGSAPLPVTPVDVFVRATWRLARDPRAAGRTVHLVEPEPLTVRRALELVAEHAGTRPPRGFIPARLARALLRAPGLARLTRAPAAALDLFASPVVYDQTTAHELLAGTGLEHPRFADYVGNLVPFIRARLAERLGGHDDETVDPLA
jgi:dephospho-CoA kinase